MYTKKGNTMKHIFHFCITMYALFTAALFHAMEISQSKKTQDLNEFKEHTLKKPYLHCIPSNKRTIMHNT